jgi:hypothetical protein
MGAVTMSMSETGGRDAEELARAYRDLRRERAELARTDINAFVEFVGRYRGKTRPDGTRVRRQDRLVQTDLHRHVQGLMDDRRFLILQTFPELGKSTQAAMRIVHLLGQDQDRQFAFISKTDKKGSKARALARTVRLLIESADVGEVFPELLPGPVWTDSEFTVKRRSMSGQLTVRTYGVFGDVTGDRLDGIVLDDPYDQDVQRSPDLRKKLVKWITGSLPDRLSREGFILLLCNNWDARDPANVLAEDPRSVWYVARIPIHDANKRNVLPEIWPEDRLAEMRSSMLFGEYERAFELKRHSDQVSPFVEKTVLSAIGPAEGIPSARADERDPGYHVVIGVDPAHLDKEKAADTAVVVVGFHEDDDFYEVLWIEAGHWKPTHTAMRVLDLEMRFDPDLWAVESNGAQVWMRDIVKLQLENERLRAWAGHDPDEGEAPDCLYRLPKIWCRTTTAKNKFAPTSGVEVLSIEFEQGMWRLPSRTSGPCAPHVSDLVDGMTGYSRKGHTDDRLMALWLAALGVARVRRRIRGQREEQERDDEVAAGGITTTERGAKIAVPRGAIDQDPDDLMPW